MRILQWLLVSAVLPWHIARAVEGGLEAPDRATKLSRGSDGQKDLPSHSFWTSDDEPVPPITNVLDSSSGNATRNFVSATLHSHMVLQRDRKVILWGYSKKGAIVTTSLFDDDDSEETVAKARLILSTTADGDDGLWRQTLPPHAASLKASRIQIKSTTGQTQTLENVLFGDVYLCGGQSNMQFALPGNTNGTEEANKGNAYSHIRITTIGDRTSSSTPLPDLQTVDHQWSKADNHTLYGGGIFGHFSSVCWFFAKEVADALGNKVPIGLISNNWGGTKIEQWLPKGNLYNAMINPYMVGPMAVTGFTWYQGESNAGSTESSKAYSHQFPEMIQAWRDGFKQPDAYFGFVQLSTWCPPTPEAVPLLRQSQMAALKLNNVGYSTNADMGAGCNIHPPPKQFCGYRLGKSALAIQYGHPIHWKSPSYSKAKSTVDRKHKKKPKGKPSVVVQFQDISSSGLYLLKTPYNAQVKDFSCKGKPAGTCAGAAVLLNGKGWVDASISIKSNTTVTLTASTGDSRKDSIVATSYGWGSVPMMTIYDKATDLPVLPWNEKI